MWRKPPSKQCFRAIIFLRIAAPRAIRCQLSDLTCLMKTNMQTIPRGPKPVWWDIWSGNYMEMRLRTPVTRGYFFLLGAFFCVNAASVSIRKKYRLEPRVPKPTSWLLISGDKGGKNPKGSRSGVTDSWNVSIPHRKITGRRRYYRTFGSEAA